MDESNEGVADVGREVTDIDTGVPIVSDNEEIFVAWRKAFVF